MNIALNDAQASISGIIDLVSTYGQVLYFTLISNGVI